MRTARRESGCRCSLIPARVPRRIPKGIPSWPYGRFTRYTLLTILGIALGNIRMQEIVLQDLHILRIHRIQNHISCI